MADGPIKWAIGNRKGGVGKTSMTLGLAMGLGLMGKRVLVIDLDPQANATAALDASGEFNIYDVLKSDEPGILGQAIIPTEWRGIDLVPGSGTAANIESESMMAPEMRLKSAAHGDDRINEYDHVLMDLPPALGRLTLNGLLWADRVIVVTEPQAFSVQGLTEFLDTVGKVKSLPHLNPELVLDGIMVNKTSSPLTTEHEFQIQELEGEFGDLMRAPYLPSRTAMQDAVSARLPLSKVNTRGAAVLTERFVTHARRMHGVK